MGQAGPQKPGNDFYVNVLGVVHREVWPEESAFGLLTVAPEEELMLLQDIFRANLNSGKRITYFGIVCFFGVWVV